VAVSTKSVEKSPGQARTRFSSRVICALHEYNRNSLLVSNSVTTVGNWETFEGAPTSLISPDFHSGEFRRLVPMMNPHRHLPRRRAIRSMKCLRPLLHIHCSNSKKSKELKEKPSIPTQKTPLAALLFYSGADVTDLDG